jgi:hypothetical protein
LPGTLHLFFKHIDQLRFVALRRFMVSTSEVGGYVGDAVGVGDFAERKF